MCWVTFYIHMFLCIVACTGGNTPLRFFTPPLSPNYGGCALNGGVLQTIIGLLHPPPQKKRPCHVYYRGKKLNSIYYPTKMLTFYITPSLTILEGCIIRSWPLSKGGVGRCIQTPLILPGVWIHPLSAHSD